MQLWAKGYSTSEIDRRIGDGRLPVTEGGRLVKVLRSEIGDYLDAHSNSALSLWHRWKTFNGLPFSGGWARQPTHIIEALEAAEAGYSEVNRGSR